MLYNPLMVSKEEIIKKAKRIEEESYSPAGRNFDGAPYDTFAAKEDFFTEAFIYFGKQQANDENELSFYTQGVEFIILKVKERKQNGERNANPDCGNWWLWTIFNELGVSRIRE